MSAKTRTAEFSGTGVDSAVWLFSTQNTAGSLRAAHRLIASCHSPSELPPSPMNEKATRPAFSRQNAIAMPAIDSDPTDSGAAAGSTPHSKSPVWRSLPRIGGPALPICARRIIATASASLRIARVTPRSRITGATTSPVQVPSAPRKRSPRFSRMPAAKIASCPSERKPLPWNAFSPQRTSPPAKSCFSRLSTARVRHMPRRMSLRSSPVSEAAIASRCSQPSQASSICARACSRRRIAERPGRRLVEALGARDGVIEPAGQLAAEDRPQRVEAGAIARLQLAAAGGVEDLEGQMDERGVLFGHERAEARGEAGGAGGRDRTGHGRDRF